MDDRLQALIALKEAVEAGEERYPFSWANGGYTTGDLFDNRAEVNAAYNGSLDAARALMDAVLPGWFAGVSANIHGHGWYGWVQTRENHEEARSHCPARAWLLSILAALIAQEQANG